ncbi:MAG: glycosyltransferase family 4 protein [Methanomassiliicoccales archaeon]|nr:glycosyltransferase family 4 protein [Methanomassiliicoccales archaeon]
MRVRSLLLMLSSFSPVRVFHTESDNVTGASPDQVGVSILSDIHNAETAHVESPETIRTKASRLAHYYRNDVPGTTRVSVSRHSDGISGLQVESLDLLFLAKAFDGRRIPIVLDEHNVYWNMLKYGIFDSPFFRGQFGRTSVARSTLGPWLLSRAKRFEKKAIQNADKVLVTSDVDKAMIEREMPSAKHKIAVIPNCVDVARYSIDPSKKPGEDGTRKVVFVGRLDYEANADAVRSICNDMAPAFDNSVRFQIIGGPIPSLARYPSNVDFLGIVPDIRPILRDADVCIAPLRFGSGTRIKIIEYLAMGKPVVTTSVGCEGLAVENGRNILIAEDPAGQSKHIRQVLDDGRLASALGREGRRLAEEKYDWHVYVSDLRSVYESVGAI